MQQDFITIQEAARLVGATDGAVMRALRELLQEEGVDREEVLQRQPRQGGFLYLVRKSFIIERFSERVPEEAIQEPLEDEAPREQAESSGTSHDIVQLLKSVIDTKDNQIQDLSRKIDELIERDRETNILLKGLQDRLFLLEEAKKPRKRADEE